MEDLGYPLRNGESVTGQLERCDASSSSLHAGLRLADSADELAESVQDPFPDLSVMDPDEKARLAASMWRFVVVLRRPADRPRLLPSSVEVITQRLAGRYAIGVTRPETVTVVAAVPDGGDSSHRLAWQAAHMGSALLGYPSSSIEQVTLRQRPEGRKVDQPLTGGQVYLRSL
jgi:hypothetical protein